MAADSALPYGSFIFAPMSKSISYSSGSSCEIDFNCEFEIASGHTP